jgi:EAL domain-containing protein (putative c-di-GMP-specific phosphodiesterase class I)
MHPYRHRNRDGTGLEADLPGAVQRGDIVPYFQPVISLADGSTSGFEALARWIHPTRGVVPPDDFIAIAVDKGLIDAITAAVLRAGCRAARGWDAAATLSINIAPVQLRDPRLADRLLAILAETGFAPGRLIVDIAENAVIDEVDHAAQAFAALEAAGIRIALDDFGKGHSDFPLRRLRFDQLKIDSALVQTLDSPKSRKIIGAIVELAEALGMPVTAEGVETREAAEALRRIGCDQAQGYLFGAPEPNGTVRLVHN